MSYATNTTPESGSQKQPEKSTSAIKRFNMKEYYSRQFPRDVENFKNSGRIQSGYANVDILTNLYPGLYVIGAISSLGKTTFIHQMSEQIAESGGHVLFFSLEQSALELASKSIARTIAKQDAENGLSSLQVRRTDPTDFRIASAIEKCSSYSDRITVIECSFRASINNIAGAITGYIESSGVKPVVVIDYLQVIQSPPNSRMTTKDTIDYHVRRLKELQIDYQLTMIVISSLNRQNYATAIDYEAFKESGGIEYTADVVWGLQLQCIHEKLFSCQNKVNEKRQRIKEAKRENPRKIELVCLKNRFGISSYSCQFNYFSKYDLFEPDLTGMDISSIPEDNADTDGWMTIPKGFEKDLPWDTE